MSPKLIRQRRHAPRALILLLIIGGSLMAAGVVHQASHLPISRTKPPSITAADDQTPFPTLPATLSTRQRTVLELARQEFTEQSPGTKFSQGEMQAWCANFVSWVMREAGVPLTNPHTGGWRIPGIFTLQEYYQSVGRWRPVSSGYLPRPGDVAIYRNSPIFGDHTNIVIARDHHTTTTVGGNEMNRIRVSVNQAQNNQGLLGWGILE